MTRNKTLRTWVSIIFDPDSTRWMDNAACKGEPTNHWFAFATGGDKAAIVASERARSVCAGCPVNVECRDYAIQIEADGIWGGTTWHERQRIRATA